MKKIKSISIQVMALTLMALSGLYAGRIFSEGKLAENYNVASKVIDPKFQEKIILVRSEGPVENVNEWTYYFYDTTADKNVKYVKVVNGAIQEVLSGKFKKPANESYVFDSSKNRISAESALEKTKKFFSDKQVVFDRVKMELRRSSTNISPTWQVSAYQGSKYKGTAYLDDVDGNIVSYKTSKSSSDKVDSFFNDVESTFKGIGGDLEEFFTGERTVDR